MKSRILIPVLAVLALLILPVGCASKAPSETEKIESRLAAAGFKVLPATTPDQIKMVQQLTPGQLTVINRKGQDYYVYPDAQQQQLYVGQQAQYQAYNSLIEIEEANQADAKAEGISLKEARNNDPLSWAGDWATFDGTR